MSKNLTFKLVMEADTKGFVSNIKHSEKTLNEAFKAIKDGNAKFVADAKSTNEAIKEIIPSEVEKKVAQLVSELHSAGKALGSLGSDASVSAESLQQLGDYGEKALQGLKDDLQNAKLHLNMLAATKATPEDIAKAQQEVKELETGVKQVTIAFNGLQGQTKPILQAIEQSAKDVQGAVVEIVPSETQQRVGQLVTELNSATKSLDSMGNEAQASAENIKQLGDYGASALDGLQNDLKQAKLHLNYLSATNATPADIENAQREVKELETGVKQVKTAFDAYKVSADTATAASAKTAEQVANIIPANASELANGLTQSLNSATKMISEAGDGAKKAAGNFSDLGTKSEKALNMLKSDLANAKQKLQDFANTNASPVDIEVAQRQVDQLEKEVQQADQAFNDFQAEVGRANTQLKETDSAAASAKKGLDGAKFAVNALVGAMAALGVGLGLRELAEAADAYTGLSARIQIATKDGGNFGSAMAGVHQVALATNSSLQATGDLFTRIDAVGKEMGMTQQQALDLTKTVTQAIQIGGGSAQASEAAITQFIQAMQGGVLRGEEFNSIMENGYGLAEALAKGLGVTTGELRKMAENGELTSERVAKALQSQAAQVQSTYDQFPTTIGNALQRIQTSWQILIGTMDQANGASATVAEWLVMIADNMGIVGTLIDDLGDGFIWVGDQLKKIDPSVWVSLKNALSGAYDAIKDVVVTLAELGKTVSDVLGTGLSAALSVLSSLTSEVTEAGEQVSFLERVLQGLSVAFGVISDAASGIKIGVNLLTGAFFDLAGAANSVLAALTWGDLSKQFAANADLMKQKAKEYYAEADRDAQGFKSKSIAAIEEIGKTQTEKDAESVASSKAKLEKLLADQTAEVDGKKASEQEKLKAVQDYAEAAIRANGGAMDGTMQADLMTKGYIVTMNEAGKVSVEAWDAAAESAEKKRMYR